ncbi:MAG TPA: LysR family transcriptional regulator [Ramlibacter sp.]|uniref:LysR family transcriptional regulator n=1 Tax=Ramlibacter sp. TaxID=1917967 RepID=UPI002BCC945D|nr:LysR family transcriptional regulator [Ramlibacter sp.]HVZ46335.1 LysR family transcriptional regulator [Ramlibacter sp.]
MTRKIDQRLRLTLRQLEVFAALARGGTTRAAADEISRSQSAASNALGELEAVLGVQLFDRVGKKLVINENGRALLPRAAAILEQAVETEALFTAAHAAPLRLASSYTIGEYLLPDLIGRWKTTHPRSHVHLRIANTHDVFDAVASFTADLGFIEGSHTHPALTVRRWRSDELTVIASPKHPLAGRRASPRALQQATWILREPGSGTREASDRWLIPNLPQMEVELELGSNEAVKRAVASGMGIGCLSRLAVEDAVASGWLVELSTSLPPMRRALAIVLHRAKKLGSAAEGFLKHCVES